MNTENLIAFYSGLALISIRYPDYEEVNGELRTSVLVIYIDHKYTLRPLNSITKEVKLWREIDALFQKVLAKAHVNSLK